MNTAISRNPYDRGCPHGIMFHRFHASHESDQSQGALTPDEFDRILVHVGIENILSPLEWMSRLEKNCLGAQDLCLTFDDGLRSQLEYAMPVLNRHGLQAFWFIYSCVFDGKPLKSEIYSHVAGQVGGMPVLIEEFLSRCPSGMLLRLDSDEFRTYAKGMCTDYPFYTTIDIQYRFLRGLPEYKEDYEGLMDQLIGEQGFDPVELTSQLWLTEDDLKTLTEKGHSVGLHSYDHPYDLAQLIYEEQRQQYETNYAHIVSVTQRKPTSVAHPLNSYNGDSLAVLQQLGIQCGFRANMLPPPPTRHINPHCLELAREDAVNVLSEMNDGCNN